MKKLVKHVTETFNTGASLAGAATTLLCIRVTQETGASIFAGIVLTALLSGAVQYRRRRAEFKPKRDGIHVGDRQDERLAAEANRLVREQFKKNTIDYATYCRWRGKNPLIFTPVISAKGELVGFFDVFPLTDEAGRKLMSGEMPERDLTIDSICSMADGAQSNVIYIATVMINPRCGHRKIAKGALMGEVLRFVRATYPPNNTRSLCAFAHTLEGEHALRERGFVTRILKGHSPQKDALYALSAAAYAQKAAEFETVGRKWKSAARRVRAGIDNTVREVRT